MIDWKELNNLFDCLPKKRPRRRELQLRRARKHCFGHTGLLHYKRKKGLEPRLGAPRITFEDVVFENKMKKEYKKLGIPYTF